MLLATLPAWGQWHKTAQQIPSLASLPDLTDQLQRQLDEGNGCLLLTSKHYRITRPLRVELAKHGAVAIRSSAGSTLIMSGPGPALQLIGTHTGTASPTSFQPATWNERMPTISGIEILGADPQADGIELQATVGAIIDGVSIRWCRHAVHLIERNRNVIVGDCHLYENSGAGVFLDDVNLHQINVANSHISYNRSGGVVVRDGNVRNLQITGCDIEGNMPGDETPTQTANVLIDVSGSTDDPGKSIAEIAITGCTIQHSANYSGDAQKSVAPGGANVRLAGKAVYPIDSVAITGNVLSDTSVNIDVGHARDVTIQANTFFAPNPDNLRVADSQRIVVSGNTFNPREFARPGTIRFARSADCILANSTIHNFAGGEGAIVLEQCSGFTINGLSLSDCGSGIVLRETSDTTIANCRVSRTQAAALDLWIDPSNQRIGLSGNSFAGRAEIASAAVVLMDQSSQP
jgi:parallel beta-helix repeat protein